VSDGETKKPKDNGATIGDREIIITRVFDAPREIIWDAWTDPEQIVKWWGPRGFTSTIHEMDVRSGGVWQSTMYGPDGTEYLNHCVFSEVLKPERIVYKLSGGRKDDPDVQAEVSWIFEAQGTKTKLTLHMLFPTVEARDRSASKYKVIEGGNQILDRLREHLEKSTV
jgi:uncharacterized protein YndB with AHSA1/START domain